MDPKTTERGASFPTDKPIPAKELGLKIVKDTLPVPVRLAGK
jgi:hypothetical protein